MFSELLEVLEADLRAHPPKSPRVLKTLFFCFFWFFQWFFNGLGLGGLVLLVFSVSRPAYGQPASLRPVSQPGLPKSPRVLKTLFFFVFPMVFQWFRAGGIGFIGFFGFPAGPRPASQPTSQPTASQLARPASQPAYGQPASQGSQNHQEF